MSLPKHKQSGNSEGESQDGYADSNDGEDAEGVHLSGCIWFIVGPSLYQDGIVGEVTAGTCGYAILVGHQFTPIINPVATPLCRGQENSKTLENTGPVDWHMKHSLEELPYH